MSLKFFHVFFISVVLVFLIGFGVWAVRRHGETHETALLVAGVGSFVLAGGLSLYGRWFLRKLKDVSYV